MFDVQSQLVGMLSAYIQASWEAYILPAVDLPSGLIPSNICYNILILNWLAI